jgi:enediyne biosynthesis protein E4
MDEITFPPMTRPPANRPFRWCVLGAVLMLLWSIAGGDARALAASSAVRFTDVTKKAGIAFTQTNGAAGQKFYPETFGSGVCVIDYDRDGWPDLFFVNGRAWTLDEQHAAKTAPPPRRPPVPPSYPALYHNNRDGRFTDVTKQAGLVFESYGMGCAVGDYDNDGFPDLVVTGYGPVRLFHNTGKGSFVDVTAAATVRHNDWSTCAVWFDYDGDGDLDLFVCHYVQWSPPTDLACRLSGSVKLFCGPDPYRGESNRLYRNDLVDGRRVFTDVTQAAGLLNPKGKTLGAALVDYNDDGRLDLAVANDQVPNFLYRNNGDGTFTDDSLLLGLSVGRFGVAKAGMGIDTGDLFNDGGVAIVVGNFAGEGLTLHLRERAAKPPPGQPPSPMAPVSLFKDYAPRLGLTRPSLPFLTFGVALFDADLDGRLDIVTANGHVDADLVKSLERHVTYRERPLLFMAGNGQPRYAEIGAAAGLSTAMVGRGIAYLDYDGDGDLDLVLTENGGPAHLYRNEGGPQGAWLRFDLRGTVSNRDAIGAVVTVTALGVTQTRMVKSGSSYLSQSEHPLTFGLGKAGEADRIEIRWPSGRTQTLEKIAANQQMIVVEPAE